MCSLKAKREYVAYVRGLKQPLNHGLVLQKVHRATKFDQRAWLEEYIDMNKEVPNYAKMVLKIFFQVGE